MAFTCGSRAIRLHEVTRECGQLHLYSVEELENYPRHASGSGSECDANGAKGTDALVQ
jgi:hypothetical protein